MRVKLLILGGTSFLGRHLVETALSRGVDVTLFNRGITAPGLFPEAETICGDRDGGLFPLKGRYWDAVIDTCGYLPRLVRDSSRLLVDHTRHYTFVSNISAYAAFARSGQDETAPLAALGNRSTEEVTPDTYGPLKAVCEKEVEQALPERSLILRPGLIVGPYDPTDRFTYWPARLAEGGEVLAPGHPKRRVQWIDVRDLANWMLSLAEQGKTGIYNAVGPAASVTMEEFLLTGIQALNSRGASLIWTEDTFLQQQQVEPWMELPLWIPQTGPWVEKNGPMQGMLEIDNQKALSEGLSLRPLAKTMQDTLTWDQTRPRSLQRKAGISREREQQLLATMTS